MLDDITTCWECGGQPEWDNNDYSRDFTYWGIDRSQPIALPLSERPEPMETTDESIIAEQNPAPGEQRVDISELLIAMKNAIERMGSKSTHRGIMVTAGSVIIHLITENRKLAEICEGYHQATQLANVPEAPTVTLT